MVAVKAMQKGKITDYESFKNEINILMQLVGPLLFYPCSSHLCSLLPTAKLLLYRSMLTIELLSSAPTSALAFDKLAQDLTLSLESSLEEIRFNQALT